MKNTLVVIADLGCFKAYRLEVSPAQRTPRLELIEQFDNPEAHKHLVDQVSDQSGRFPRGGAGMSDGERHNVELEQRKRFLRQLADRFNRLAANGHYERCWVAISREINKQLVDELNPAVRNKIEQNLAADLTKTDRAEVLDHFMASASNR
jgi:Protein required for attachment to host cells